MDTAHLEGNRVHVYLGLPWATWIDYQGVHKSVPPSVEQELEMQRIRIQGLRRIWAEMGCKLRVHTVCQHIHWRRLVKSFSRVGVTDLWLSHAPAPHEAGDVGKLALHSWHLYAVNVEDAARRRGLRPGKPPAEKRILASFIGAHEHHYLNESRLRLRELVSEPDCVIEVMDRWHYHSVVYDHQMRGKALADSYSVDDSVERYNRILSDSLFSLCPPGAGANTLRLWESLAVGAVPVLFEPLPRIACDIKSGNLSPPWKKVAVVGESGDLQGLIRRLRGMPVAEVAQMADAGARLYEQLRRRNCIHA